MSDKIGKAFDQLVEAITEEVADGVSKIQTTAMPIVAQLSGLAAIAAMAGKTRFEDLFKTPEAPKAEEPKKEAAPIPTPEQNTAIKALKVLNKTDEEIAEMLGINVLTVKMVW